ncbi:TPA: hypothetical protein HA246_04635 [Candidatus Woesearchaeota archaeon]|nr:hypothetical protein [Candidatus Woesearchaeota archaeon]
MKKITQLIIVLLSVIMLTSCSSIPQENISQKQVYVQEKSLQKDSEPEPIVVTKELPSPKEQTPIPSNTDKNLPAENNLLSKLTELKDNLLYPREQTYFTGDLIVTNREHIINNTKFVIKGNIFVNGTGKLIVKDSELVFNQDFNQQFRVYIQDNAMLDFENVKLTTDGKWFNFQYNNNPQIKFKNVHGEGCCSPWHGSSDNVKFDIKESTVGLTLSQNVKVDAVESSLFFELVMTNTSGTFNLPKGHVDDYSLKIPNNENNLMQIDVKNSEFTDWGTTLDKYTNITFVDSKMTIGINAGSDWERKESQNAYVKVSGLKTKTYPDFSLDFDTNKLRLINTFTRDWYPQAFNNATIEISDSDLADLQNYGGTSRAIVRNSNAMIAIARENVTYYFYDSIINQDVIAHDNANIYLYNTKVKGRILENGNGKVWVDGKRLEK